MVTTTDELVERFNKWAVELAITLRPMSGMEADEVKARFARMETLDWAVNNLKRIRDEIERGK